MSFLDVIKVVVKEFRRFSVVLEGIFKKNDCPSSLMEQKQLFIMKRQDIQMILDKYQDSTLSSHQKKKIFEFLDSIYHE